MRKTFLLPALATLAVCAPVHALNLDVNGVTIGTEFNAGVKDVLQKVNPAYQITDVKDGEQVVGYIASAGNKRNPFDAFVVLRARDGKIWFAGRRQTLGEGKRIAQDGLLAALKEKYSDYSATETRYSWNKQAIWRYSRDTSQIPLPSINDDPCGDQKYSNFHDVPYPVQFAPGCQIAITAEWREDDDNLISRYTVTAYDARTIHDELRERQAQAEIEQQKAREKAAAEGQSNKPNL